MAFGVTQQGFIMPTIEELRLEIYSAFRSRLGSDIKLIPETLSGALAEVYIERQNEVWGALERNYYSRFIATADGVSLDHAAWPIIRRGEISAVTQVTITGTASSIIPIGTIFETADGREYQTSEAIQIEVGGSGSGSVFAVVAGPGGNTESGSITIIPTPVPGLDTVTNPSAAAGGSTIENDADFRLRVRSERLSGNNSSIVAIENRILAVANVVSARVFENVTDETDSNNLQPHSIEAVVIGGANREIAEAIAQSKAGGIATNGPEVVDIVAANMQTIRIRFSRGESVPIFVNIDIETNTDYDNASDNVIKDRVLQYIGGVTPGGVAYDGLGLGQTVYAWRAVGAIFVDNQNRIPGIENVTATLGLVSIAAADQSSLTATVRQEFTSSFDNIGITKS